jgi:hypothetical protein
LHATDKISCAGVSAAVKVININRESSDGWNSSLLIDSFQKEIRMAYKMRQETRHVVTIYGFDFDMRTGLALIAMELGGDTLTMRLDKLHAKHSMKIQHHPMFARTNLDGSDFISSSERKNIWVQLTKIVQTLYRNRVVSINDQWYYCS